MSNGSPIASPPIVFLEDAVDILDSRRRPINATEREHRLGDVPYYGATGQVGWIDDFLFDEELVLLGEDGAPFLDPTKPKAYIVRGKSWVNNHAHVLRARPGLLNSFLLHQLNNLDYRNYVSGTTRLKLPQGAMKRIPLLLPAEPEQARVVAELEEQFTRLDAGVAGLRRAQANLKHYRAAVLKAACEGRLMPTEAEVARRESRSYETGTELLQRTSPTGEVKRRGATNQKALLSETTDAAPMPLPEGWEWTTLDAVTEIKGGITKDRNRKTDAPARLVPYLRVANVQRGYLDLTEVKRILATEAEIRELALAQGDILFNEGGDRDKLGRGWVWSAEIPECIHQNHVFRARLFNPDFQPKFLSWYANSFGQAFFFAQGKHTTNLASISMSKLRRLPVPVPPVAEQRRIVSAVDTLLSIVSGTEHIVEASVQRAKRLRQAILHHAFGRTPDGADSNPTRRTRPVAPPRQPREANVAETELPMPTPSSPVESLTQLLNVLGALGGSASPEALLTAAGLSDDLERFFDLLREGDRSGQLSVPVGHTGAITRSANAD